jgi:acetyl/propionyl-CoA carboxylase alpha subunit
MNTRLQVEHTVTEAVTGLDLVEWQLRVAAGEPLPLSQEQIRLTGHAVEARVCAEDPWRDFMPSAGVLALAEWPRGEAVRVDAGFASGDVVPPSYDSLLAKVIAWAPEREQAIARLAQALERTCLAGIHTNERWLARLLRSPAFLERRQSVTLLDRSARELAPEREPDTALWVLAALGLWGLTAGAGDNPWALADGFRPGLPASIDFQLALGTHSRRIALELSGGRPGAARVEGGCAAEDAGGARVELAGVRLEGQHVQVRIGSVLRRARLLRRGSHLDLWMGDEHRELLIEDPRTREFTASAASGGLVTPLPGVVSEVAVAVGQRVAAGELLMVIEAMKMEHSISAPHEGVVSAIHFARGERVPEGSELLELSPPGVTETRPAAAES